MRLSSRRTSPVSSFPVLNWTVICSKASYCRTERYVSASARLRNCRKNCLKWRRGTHSFLSLSLSLSGAPVLHCQMPLVRASRLSCLTSYGAPYDVRVRFRGGWVDGASPPSECVTHSLTRSLTYARSLARTPAAGRLGHAEEPAEHRQRPSRGGQLLGSPRHIGVAQMSRRERGHNSERRLRFAHEARDSGDA